MPQKTWAVGEEVLAADFNTYVQNQTIPVFTGTTQRDAQWPSPPGGAVCVTADTNTLWLRVGSTWWACLSRVGASTPRTSDFGFSGTTPVQVLSAVVAGVPSGRKLRVVGSFAGLNSAAVNDRAYLQLRDGATVLHTLNVNTNANYQSNGGVVAVTHAPSAGSHTYTLYAVGGSAGNYNIQAPATGPITLEVFDVGGV